ncbi:MULTISPECIES: hypothetical protein [unclassified Neisseria]|uniref:hypothetical protein n=1 Tax=unclassified Neisseria TaxID=2623750 RepID=UPI00143063A8|nr:MULTISPECIES: hypothetical protein [unclassified Neisseria]MBF0804743.1 hypothetical protein [Neisseria sp. 19428wB4_WF04]
MCAAIGLHTAALCPAGRAWGCAGGFSDGLFPISTGEPSEIESRPSENVID